MEMYEIKPAFGSSKRRKIVGRGPRSGHGKTSCRGQKGQGSRQGRATLLGSEGGQSPLIRRLPKVGFRSKSPIFYQVVNVENLNKFENGAIVNAALLKQKGLIKSLNKPFKILGEGEVKKNLIVHAQSISKSAQNKIVKAGGKVEIVEKPAAVAEASSKS